MTEKKARRQHINFTLSLECALHPRAQVSVFLVPRQPFLSKHQIAHISIHDGNEKKATPGRTSSLRVSRRSVGAWGMGLTTAGKYCLVPRIQRCCVLSWFDSSTSSSAPTCLGLGEGRKSDLGPGHCLLLRQEHWAITRGVATQNITSLSPLAQSSFAANQGQGWQKKRGGGVVRTRWPCHQALTGQKIILSLQSLKVELDQGEEPALSRLGFFCTILSSTMAWSMVSDPTSRTCWEEIALSEFAIPPIQEVAAYPWCTVCEHLRSRNCPGSRQAEWAHVGWSP